LDVITKEEFDSKRGGTEEPSADSEMVFPLDLPESGKTEGSGVPVKHSPATAAATTPVVQGGEREVGKRDGHSVSPSKVPAQSAKRKSSREKPEKRARFYPLPNKQESPAKVRECQVRENGQELF